MPTKRILLGHIGPPHGVRGEVTVRSYAAEPEDIGAYGALQDESGKRSFVITSAKASAKGVIVRFAGVVDRTGAEALRGTALYVERSKLPEPDAGDYYHEDLVGLVAVAPDGTTIGNVVAVQNFGAGNLLEIRLAGSSQTEFVPFTDAHVPVVDIAGGRATVVMPVMVGERAGEESSE